VENAVDNDALLVSIEDKRKKQRPFCKSFS